MAPTPLDVYGRIEDGKSLCVRPSRRCLGPRRRPTHSDAHLTLPVMWPQLLPWSSETRCHPPTCDA
jgi:hypothetical protein